MKLRRIFLIDAPDRVKPLADLLPRDVPADARLAVVALDADSASRRAHVHDLSGAVTRVRSILALLERGVAMSDDQRQRFAGLLREATETLEREQELWEELYGS